MKDSRPIQLTTTRFAMLVVAVLLLGALLGGGGTYLLMLKHALSDEPPIRVKGGSIEAEIASGSWVPASNGNPNDWDAASGGTNTTGRYFMKLVRSGGTCDEGPPPNQVLEVRVTHPDELFALKLNGNKTRLSTRGRATGAGNKVTYSNGQEFVRTLWVHGQGGAPWTCTFDARGQFVKLCLCVSQSACSNECL